MATEGPPQGNVVCAITPITRIRDPGTPSARLLCRILAWHLALASLSLLLSKQTKTGLQELLALQIQLVLVTVERHRIDKAVFPAALLKMQHWPRGSFCFPGETLGSLTDQSVGTCVHSSATERAQ